MKKSQIAIFISIIFGILLLAHFVVYEALFLVFPGFANGHVGCLRLATVLLPLLFIGANFVAFKYNNLFSRAYYKIMATWIGLVLYLFLAGLILSVASIVFSNLQIPGEILFGAAILISIYGLINSQDIQILKVKISLKNLPEGWINRPIVFVSDFHLGQVRGERFARKVAAKINQLKPDIVLIGGDLYDGVKCDMAQIISPLKNIQAEMGIYFITGNHDGFTDKDTEEDIHVIAKSGITVLRDKLVNIDGLQFIGVDYKHTTDKKRYADILQKLNIDPNAPSILIKHVPDNIDVAVTAGVSLQLSGHTHRAQVWPFGFLPRRIYKGFDYGLKKSGLTQVLTSSGVGTWGPPLRVGTHSEIVLITLEKE